MNGEILLTRELSKASMCHKDSILRAGFLEAVEVFIDVCIGQFCLLFITLRKLGKGGAVSLFPVLEWAEQKATSGTCGALCTGDPCSLTVPARVTVHTRNQSLLLLLSSETHADFCVLAH